MLTAAHAATFASVALSHVRREFPHTEGLRLNSAADLATPSVLHPTFYGSYDWHSCVHSYWLLARLLKRFPQMDQNQAIVSLFDQQLTEDKLSAELDYFLAPGRMSFERPYGWAWLLKLSVELQDLPQAGSAQWWGNLQPLVGELVQRFQHYLARLSHPVRSGQHSNTAFALTWLLDYAEAIADAPLQALVRGCAMEFYMPDQACQAWEPGGEDFLSPAWQEALLMQRVFCNSDFVVWLSAFLPGLAAGQPAQILLPVESRDRSDGRLAHLDGLNLSRAWCMRSLAEALGQDDARHALLTSAAAEHRQRGMQHLEGDYMGAHWLATFALLALDG